jgi:soluble lytic murein transglycosylase-like protein
LGQFKIAAVPLALIFVAMGTVSAAAGQYVVKPGDTLWGIAQAQRISLGALLAGNQLGDPNRIHPGQLITVPDPPPGPRGAAARAIITAQAHRHGLNPNFALALSYWESGWNQDVVSKTGAVGLMQIEPLTARSDGPSLLHRTVNIHDANDNAELGVALLRHYLDAFNGDPKLALAAYYQGETATRKYGIYPSSQNYVNGIWDLRNRFQTQGIPG